MKKLSKKQRHEVYKKAVSIVETGSCGCYALFSILYPNKVCIRIFYKNTGYYFPEYYLFKPDDINYGDRWFEYSHIKRGNIDHDSAAKHRTLALQLCIEMTK